MFGTMPGSIVHSRPLSCFYSGHLVEAGRLYKEALKLAESKGDGEVVEQIKNGLQELSKMTSRAS